MDIIKAEVKDLNAVKQITSETIEAVYPRYYPKGAVNFFLAHHSAENIERDIKADCVFVLVRNNTPVGTVTVKNNQILRLFVLPMFQKQGLGRKLMDFAEEKISEGYNEIEIDASLPAKKMYLKRGYIETSYNSILTENGDYLCYDEMKKTIK